jgi:glycosyltransferase involved in cell wall biosynthesis
VRILVFHGYLLRGTGSNVYNARLCAGLAREGHQVDLLCQERRARELPFVDAVGSFEDGRARVETLRDRGPGEGSLTVWRPDIGNLLPVYVADRYEGIEARPFPDCTDEEIENYVARNVAAVRAVREGRAPDIALANHLVMGPLVLARALDGAAPYAVKIHGSALEYTVKPHPERFLPAAREGLARARTVLVGSRHTAESLWEAMDDATLPPRTRLGPPGVDVEEFVPREPGEARARLARRAAELAAAPAERSGLPALARTAGSVDAPAPAASPPAPESAFTRDTAAAGRALARLDPGVDRLVVFVGKLIVSKGVDVLAVAWPLVLARVPSARLVVVGFGGFRAALERLVEALAAGDLEAVAGIAAAGRSLEGGPPAPLRYVEAFFDGLEGAERDAYVAAAARLPDRVVLTGRLEHDELADLLPACEALVVPSTFPEAFGMVAAEAAACATFPVSAAHSGLAEVSATLADAVPPAAAPLLSFPLGPGAVRALADRIGGWLEAPEDLRARTRDALVATARERYSWKGVARSVVAAAQGRLDELPPPT